MFSAIEHRWRKQADKWLRRSPTPEAGEVFLHQRRVYIVPSRPGLLFFVMLVALFIGAVNYNLSLGFGFTFLLAACAVIDMYLTFRNLAHLSLAGGRALPIFAGEEAQFELHLINRRKHGRYAIFVDFFGDGSPEIAQAVDIAAHSASSVILSAPTIERGWLNAPRVRLQTRFPLGLLRAWSYWQPDNRVLVYPHPEENAPALPQSDMQQNGQGQNGQDDFAGIRNYQAGDSLKRLAWRHIARMDVEFGGALVTKHFEGGAATEHAIDFESLPRSMNLELKLSRMTSWIIEAEAFGAPYAFRLGNVRLAAGIGPAHRETCLRALALYSGS